MDGLTSLPLFVFEKERSRNWGYELAVSDVNVGLLCSFYILQGLCKVVLPVGPF